MTFWQEFAARLRVLFLAVAVHALAAALIVLSTMNWQPFRKPQNQGLMIEAVMVDTSQLTENREKAREAVEQEKLRDERDQRLEQQREREQEEDLKKQQDLAKEEKRQEELEAQRKLETREKQINEKKLEEQRKLEAQDKLKKLRQEQEKKAEEERKRKQTELDKIRVEREAAEKKAKLDAERLKQIENQRLTQEKEKVQKEAEAELAKKLGEEARAFQAGREAELSDEYQAAIQSFVTQNWLRPPTAQPGLKCTVRILQIPGGEVISAAIRGSCNGDEATRRSIVAAVERGGSLPYNGFEKVFEREIDFNFSYDGD